jgi:hypothetical protein
LLLRLLMEDRFPRIWVANCFTRLTNGFSKKFENHAAMVAIHSVYYNFARIHKTLRITPSMAAGLSDHAWSLEEIVTMADNYMPKPGKEGVNRTV